MKMFLFLARRMFVVCSEGNILLFLDLVFICSMEYLVCVCAASLVEKERCKETKWRYDRVEKAARIVGRARDCIHRSLVKVMFAVGGNKL